MTVTGLQLGAPGVYLAPVVPDRSLRPVRLDVAGFAGVAPRGPVDRPTLVRSWSDYQLWFGRFEGPGLLPYAVSSFFDQGGQRAYVVRVGRPGPEPDAATDPARALLELDLPDRDEPVRFVAANPGTWGGSLTVRLAFDATPQFLIVPLPPAAGATAVREIVLPDGLSVPAGSLLRIRGPAMQSLGEFRWVDRVEQREVAPGKRARVAVLDRSVPHVDPGTDARLTAATVTGTLLVDDGDRELPRAERLPGLGLDPRHPEFLARIAGRDSLLVRPVGEWTGGRVLPPDPLLPTVANRRRLRAGLDVDHLIERSSFFDERTDLGLDDELDVDPEIAVAPDTNPNRFRGATGLARVRELGLLCVPDLFWAWPDQQPAQVDEPEPPSATFRPCTPVLPPTRYRVRNEPVLLDAGTPAELTEILARQTELIGLAERHKRFVALLDVPQNLDVRTVAAWRSHLNSSYAAAYHPWLGVTRAGATQGPTAVPARVLVPPSAFAAGIIAARERRLGLPWGPANELASGAVVSSSAVTAAEHDILHPLGINVFHPERDGFRLTAARTLSRDPSLRQLSVRRLLTMLTLALDRQMQWVVFEPSTPALRELLRHTLLTFLRGFYRAGAFVGASEEEAFFVRVDDGLNPAASVGLGRLVVEVGVAPAEPVEFIVLRITRDGDGDVRVAERTTDG